jgi:peptidoglycan hydrolase CwlO-like protein
MYVAIGIGVILLVMLILFAIGKGKAVMAVFDFILTRLKLILSLFGLVSLKNILKDDGSKAMQEIKAENDRIKAELEALKQRLLDADEKLKAEREKHEKEIARFNALIKENDAQIKEVEGRINLLRSQTSVQWFNSLPQAEKDKMLIEIRKDIKWEP